MSIVIGTDRVHEVTSDVHLGHKIDSCNFEDALVKDAKGSFWASFNKLLSSFGSMRPDILSKLMVAYCSSFYGAAIWSYRSYYSVATAWRTGLKRVWNMPRATHRTLVSLVAGSMPLEVCFHKRFLKFTQSAMLGPSKVTATVMQLVRGNYLSVFNQKFNFMQYLYKFDISDLSSIDCDRFFINGWRNGVPENMNDAANTLRELLIMQQQGTELPGISNEDLGLLVDLIAAS